MSAPTHDPIANRQDLLDALLRTADDDVVSRGERKALTAVIAELGLDEGDRVALQAALFAEVGNRMVDPRDRRLVEWLGDVLKLVRPPGTTPAFPAGKAWFGPEDPMVQTLLSFVGDARRSLDIAVFTITDDRLAEALMSAQRRGVAVRILTDDDKSWDLGSDVEHLRQAGLALAMDRSPHHFHHKFAVRDGSSLLNGSYNWTRGADRDNRENFLVTHEPALVARYAEAFEALWSALA